MAYVGTVRERIESFPARELSRRGRQALLQRLHKLNIDLDAVPDLAYWRLGKEDLACVDMIEAHKSHFLNSAGMPKLVLP